MTATHEVLDASRPRVVIRSTYRCDTCGAEAIKPAEGLKGWTPYLDGTGPFKHACPSQTCATAAASAVKQRSYARR